MTATTAPTREEIDELIAFIREELETRAACALPPEADGYRESASRALSIAERLPALVEERDDARAGRGMISDRSFETGLQMMDIAAERDRLAAEVERLTNERSKPCNSAESSLSAARATIAELREALEALNTSIDDFWNDPNRPSIANMPADSVGEVSRAQQNARAALAKLDALPTETIDAPGPAHVELLNNPPVVVDDAWPDHVTFEAPKRGRYEVTIKPIDEALAANPLPEELANTKPFDEMTEEELRAGLEGLVPPPFDARLAETERALAEAVEIIRRFAFPGRNGPHDVADHSICERARAFVEKHGGMK